MNVKRTYKLEQLPDDKSSIEELKKLDDKSIACAAKADPDAPLLTKRQLDEFKRTHPPKDMNVKKVREELHMSQSVFATLFGISKRTLQEWEQGRRKPSGAALTLLAVIVHDPEAVEKALAGI